MSRRRWARVLLLGAVLTTALGFDWNYPIVNGNSGTYRIRVADFSAAEIADISAGSAVWNAGPWPRINRGADFTWYREADATTGALCNGKHEVYKADQAYFDDHGWGGDIAETYNCLALGADIVFKSDETWCTEVPSVCSSGYSIGQTAAHEFGHRMGANHYDPLIALMNYHYPNGGDLGGVEYRLNEDDYVGLVTYKGDSSTGVNLLLSRFYLASYGIAGDGWASGNGETWRFDRSSDAWTNGPPGAVQAVIEGTSVASPLIEWRLSPDPICFAGTEYALGTVQPTIGSGVPFAVQPSSWSLVDTAPASTYYYLCARIDSNGVISESSEVDNTIVSEHTVYVIP